ncbi:MAG: hypothetical protein ACTHJ0_10735 [Flavipsychrobacter sp.]
MNFKGLITILLPLYTFGQTPGNFASSSISGTIEIPSLVDMSVSSPANDRIVMNTFEDFANGKTFPSFFKIRVKSNRPWNISVMSNSSHLSSALTGGRMPVELISLRPETSTDFVSISSRPKPFMHNANNNIENTYNVDLKIDPPLNYYGGEYDFNVIFIITAL